VEVLNVVICLQSSIKDLNSLPFLIVIRTVWHDCFCPLQPLSECCPWAHAIFYRGSHERS